MTVKPENERLRSQTDAGKAVPSVQPAPEWVEHTEHLHLFRSGARRISAGATQSRYAGNRFPGLGEGLNAYLGSGRSVRLGWPSLQVSDEP
jgi:hypothetical protein